MQQQPNSQAMTTYREIDLREMFKYEKKVTITVAPHNRKSDSEAYDLTFDNFEECKNEILMLEHENTVYF